MMSSRSSGSRSSSNSSSQIKGGGRAALSEQAEEALVSLLISLRNKDPVDSPSTRSEHDRKRDHKRFVKQLVERHERQQLARRVNGLDLEDGGDDESKEYAKTLPKHLSAGDQTIVGGSNEKVRIELVEAVFVGNTSKASSKAKKSSSKKAHEFKEGARKTMVFVRSTAVKDVMKQAKAKLRMRKKPVRCFVTENKIEMDLIGDLRGLLDGAVVYVTSEEREETTIDMERHEDVENDVLQQDEEEAVDPLDALKRAYIERDHRLRRKLPCAGMSTNVYAEHPSFSRFFDDLPPLSVDRAQLPAAACREEVLEAVETNRVSIICGATGCGKSTQIPQYLFEGMVAAGSENMAQILVTQPRRVAAMSLAQRVAFERQSPKPGAKNSLVGYIVRLDRSVSPSAKIVYCTIGILLRMLTNPQERISVGGNDDNSKEIPLSSYSHICLDECHERDLNTDFCLTLIRSILSVNKHIRIVLMSATAASDVFKNYFNGVDGLTPRIIDIPGRSFPVDIKWLGDCQRFASTQLTGWSEGNGQEDKNDKAKCSISPRATSKIDNEFICKLIHRIVEQQIGNGDVVATEVPGSGAILVFLPGKAEIEHLARTLRSDSYLRNSKYCRILRLHSTIPRGEQEAVFRPVNEGCVKVVLATNIAETSITIPDVTHVIDSGRVKESRFNASTRIKELTTVWTSQASAKQRAGRAGRVSAGVCWRLFTEEFATTSLPEHTAPEIVRAPLDELVLQVCLLFEHRRERKGTKIDSRVNGVCPVRFLSKAPEPPSSQSLMDACEHLLEVGAIEIVSQAPVLYRLTSLGYHLSRLPMDAKVGKVLIVGCILECVDPALTIAASLSCTKSCFPSQWSGCNKDEWQAAVEARKRLVESGFGGRNWNGGTVNGDSMATIAVYNAWTRKNGKERSIFCKSGALDNVALHEIQQLRNQFSDCLLDAGFLSSATDYNRAKDDAVLTSCCLVAGLYPNIATLIRPQRSKTGFKGGRLLTKDGDICLPNSNSTQSKRVGNASETGKDAYAVYHAKHRSIGTSTSLGTARMVYLQEINFISRFALLLFGGQLDIRNNAVIVDGWLKFKIGEKGLAGAVLVKELRKELDNVLLSHTTITNSAPVGGEGQERFNEQSQLVLNVVKQLLSEE